MPSLTVTSTPFRGLRFRFDDAVRIGRGADAELHIDDPTLSRRHARVERTESGWRITDLGSANGTWFKGVQQSTPLLLADGDRLRLGTLEVEFRVDAPTPSDLPAIDLGSRLGDTGSHPIARRDADSVAPVWRKGEERAVLASMVRRLELVSDVSRLISGDLDEDSLLPRILERLLVAFPQTVRGILFLCDPDGDDRLIPKVARARAGEVPELGFSQQLLREVIHDRQAILAIDNPGDKRFKSLKDLHSHRIRSLICAPMIADGEILGAIELDGDGAGDPFGKADLEVLSGIANEAALRLAHGRLLLRRLDERLAQRDLALARRIQRRFLPREMPEIAGFDLVDCYLPAEAVGGDYYDILQFAEGRLGIAMADVEGHGVPAALYMAKLASEVRFRSAGCAGPVEALDRLSAAMDRDFDEGMFVTLVLAVLDPISARVEVARGGHPLPLLCRADGSVEKVDLPPDPPPGSVAGHSYRQETVCLEPGDTLLLYTDGVIEAARGDGELFGVDRLAETLKRNAREAPAEVVDGILTELRSFLSPLRCADDVTIVCLRRRPLAS